MKKFAIEGPSFSGKTTLAKEIEKYNPNRYKMIQEYVVYAGGSENFPPWIHRTPHTHTRGERHAYEFYLYVKTKIYLVLGTAWLFLLLVKTKKKGAKNMEET